MIHPILEGILLGLTLSVLLGPVFFALLQTSINKGFFAGLSMAIGILAGDSFLILISYLGLSQIISNNSFAFYFGIAGGILLIVFGLITYRKKIRFKDMRPKPSMVAPSKSFKRMFQGFILNISNPFVWIFWISVVSAVHSNYGDNTIYLGAFFVSTMATVFTTDVLKSYLAHRIKRLIRPRTMVIINRVVGIVLIILGLVLLGRVFYNFQM